MLHILLALLVLFVVYHLYWKRRNLPPGPTPLPLIGNMHTMMKYEPGYEAFRLWIEKYGTVFTYWMGEIPFVLVNDYETIKETFIKDADSYGDRYLFEISKIYRGGDNLGMVDSNGDTWREHRRFALHQLRNMGLGKEVMEERILLEFDFLAKTLTAKQDEDVKISDLLDIATGSIINQLLFGYRFDEDHLQEYFHLKAILTDQLRASGHPFTLMVMFFPRLKHLPYCKQFMEKLTSYGEAFFAFFTKNINQHLKNIDYDSDEVTDFVDAFLKERRNREKQGDPDTFSLDQLKNVCMDMWFAGVETSSNTLSWGIVYILNNPEVQEKLHAELSRMDGRPSVITMKDKNSLPYTQAVVSEIQRLANLLPLGQFRQTTKDVVVNGYHIKKGTGIVAQISSVMFDETVFPEPQSFEPERFLDQNGKYKKIDEFIPFSVGKRQCPGEGLAKMELFLFIANLFNKFEISCSADGPPSIVKKIGRTVQFLPYTCRIKPRNNY